MLSDKLCVLVCTHAFAILYSPCWLSPSLLVLYLQTLTVLSVRFFYGMWSWVEQMLAVSPVLYCSSALRLKRRKQTADCSDSSSPSPREENAPLYSHLCNDSLSTARGSSPLLCWLIQQPTSGQRLSVKNSGTFQVTSYCGAFKVTRCEQVAAYVLGHM